MAADCPDFGRATRSSIESVLRLFKKGASGAGADGEAAGASEHGLHCGALMSHPAWDADAGACGGLEADPGEPAVQQWGRAYAQVRARGGGGGGCGARSVTPGGLPSTAEVEAPASPASSSSGAGAHCGGGSSGGGLAAAAGARAPEGAAGPSGTVGGGGGGGDSSARRFCELLQRLSELLPAVRRPRCYEEEAEGAWEALVADLGSHLSAARAAAARSPHLQLGPGEGARLRQLLAAMEQQVGGGGGAASAQEYQLASVISSIYSLTGPPTPRRAAASFDGAPSPRAGAAGAAAGGAAAAAAAASGGSTPKRTGWGRSVAPQESGLWNASPAHPASSTSCEPTPRTARGSSFTGGPASLAPSGRATPSRNPSFTGEIAAAAAAAASPRGGALSARCSSGSSRAYSGALGGLSGGCGRLPSDAALKLAALYAMPKKPESPNKLGYRVAANTSPGGGSHIAAGGGHAGGARGAGGRGGGFGSFSLACSRTSSNTGAMHAAFAAVGAAGPAVTVGDAPGFAAAKEAFLAAELGAPGAARPDKWLARLMSAGRAMGAGEVDAAVGRLAALLAANGIPLQLDRVAPFTYLMGGRRIHIREVNGRLLVRTGGGYEELLSALAKLPWSPAAAAAAAAVASAERRREGAAAAAAAAAGAAGEARAHRGGGHAALRAAGA